MTLVATLVTGGLLVVFASGSYGSPGVVSVSAFVNGASLAGSSQSHPLRLSPERAASIKLRIDDDTSLPVVVQSVALQGQVVGLTFYSFDTAVGIRIRSHSSATFRYSLDLHALRGEASGLIPGSLSVLGPNDNVIASENMVSDVRGSVVSVYGLFGLALLVLTVLALLVALVAIARHTLPANRFRRALRFMVPGIGLGLVFVFSLSALRVWVPSNGRWLAVFLICAAGFFLLGYLTPTPLASDEEDEDDEEEEGGELDEAESIGAGEEPGGSQAPGTVQDRSRATRKAAVVVPADASPPGSTTEPRP